MMYPSPSDGMDDQHSNSKPLIDGHDFDMAKATQYGCLERVRQLVEEEKVDVRQRDDQDITPLHWAAINNRLDVARYFIDHGADLDAVGGVLQATPMHWAAKRNHLPMVMLLAKSGADIRTQDGEGLTTLHQAAQSGYWTICAYLVTVGQDVDDRDKNGMTPLMWACYGGFSTATVQFFIKSNSLISAIDNRQGNTPLHFAVTADNNVVIPTLLKAGARLDVTNAAGLTPLQCARQQQYSHLTISKLEAAHRMRNNVIDQCFRTVRLNPLLARENIRTALPGVCMALFGYTAGVIPSWWVMFGVWLIISFLISYISLLFASKDPAFKETTPFGLFVGTMVMMYVTWFGFFWPYVNGWGLNTLFATATVGLIYYTYRAVSRDPGYVRQDRQARCQAILEFVDQRKNLESDSMFCATCMVKKPLRSKHCSLCDRCVGAMDHHCPWIRNCVGCGNHKDFMLYLFWLLTMNVLYLYGAYAFFTSTCLTVKRGDPIMANISKYGTCSPWVFLLTLQGIFYTFWVAVLLASQFYQVAWCAATTNEKFNMYRYRHFQRKNGKQFSPFDRGFLRNCANFFQCSLFGTVKVETVDWLQQYDISKFVNPDELADEKDVAIAAEAYQRRTGRRAKRKGADDDKGSLEEGHQHTCKHGKTHGTGAGHGHGHSHGEGGRGVGRF